MVKRKTNLKYKRKAPAYKRKRTQKVRRNRIRKNRILRKRSSLKYRAKQSKYQSKFYRKLKQRSKYAMNIINDVNPAHVSTTFNLSADSYDSNYAPILLKQLPSVGNQYRFSNVLRMDASFCLLTQNTQNQQVINTYARQPCDRYQNLKLSPYRKGRINGAKVSISFQFFGVFDGFIYIIPGIKGRAANITDSSVGNGRVQSSSVGEIGGDPVHKFFVNDTYDWQANVTSENARLQKSIKYKKIVQLEGTNNPKIHTLTFDCKFRDLDLKLRNKEEYNNTYPFGNIEQEGNVNNNALLINGYQNVGDTGGFYLNYGFYTNKLDEQSTNYCRMKIFMTQKAQLQEPKRSDLGAYHVLT